MTSEADNCRVWIKFDAKKKDGSIVKLRIKDLPKSRKEEILTFIINYVIPDEPIHKTAGIYKNNAAIEEYKKCLSLLYDLNPPQVAICCMDKDAKGEEILAVSCVQLISSQTILENFMKELKVKNKEVETFLNILLALPKFPLMDKYDKYYEGRGIMVRPDYRGLGIASHIVKQRRMLCDEHNIPLTNAWMTSLGSQKAAEREGWETVAEITLKELASLTGLEFQNIVPTIKLMMATGYNH